MSPTYLHRLSEAALQNVLRHLSARPSKPDWQLFVAPEDALTAVHSSCGLCTVARASFTRLKLRLGSEEVYGGYPQLILTPLQLTRWLLSAGQSFQDLHIADMDESPTVQQLPPMIEALDKECTALRRLKSRTDFYQYIPFFLWATRGRVQELNLSCFEDLPAFEIHCAGVRKLDLHSAPPSIPDLLRVVGPTLESFHLYYAISSDVLSQVRGLCPKLSSISLRLENDTDQEMSAYADLLCSYGPHLLSANLDYFKKIPVICKRVLASCPNVRCHVTVSINPHKSFPSFFNVLAPNLKRLDLYLHGFTLSTTEAVKQDLARAMHSCHHLERLSVSLDLPDVPAVFDCVFSHDLPVLAALRLTLDDWWDSSLLQTKSARFQTLRKFEFSGPLQTQTALNTFAANAPLLEVVTLRFDKVFRESADLETKIAGVVDAFLKCPKLRELEVSTDHGTDEIAIESVSRVCCRRGRSSLQRPYVRVLGVLYLV